MIHRFTIKMTEKEMEALIKLANKECRDYREQARFIIKSKLISTGLLTEENDEQT